MTKSCILAMAALLLTNICASAQNGTFKTAALNVDGMPRSVSILGLYNLSLNPDGKEAAGATAIGHKLKTMGYDVVGVSEDFNYHSEIWNEAWNGGVNDANGQCFNSTTHRGGIDVTGSTYTKLMAQQTLFDTDGLCLFYNTNTVDQQTLTASEQWTPWEQHYGYTDDGGDGLINKGYRYYTVRLKDGFEVDLYILHMDAETSEADNAARETQIDQLAQAILATDNHRPIIVMGDTNCRYTRDRLKSHFIDVLDLDPRFTCKDPWVEQEYDGIYPALGAGSLMVDQLGYQKGEVVDKVFYINNTDADFRINAKSYLQDITFVNDEGEPLADHWPIVIEWEYYPQSEAEEHEPTVHNPYGNGVKYYLRNKMTGEFLKTGGWWDTHAMQGVYGEPVTLSALSDGTFALKCPEGYIDADGYMDKGVVGARWNVVGDGDYYSFVSTNNGNPVALSGNDIICEYGPNRHYAALATYNATDPYQQWEMLTEEQLKDEMTRVRNGETYNATFLIQSPNFDRGDGNISSAWQGWPTSATRMNCNVSNGKTDIERGNHVAEVFVSKCSKTHLGSCTHGTTWDITQTLQGLPAGNYRVSCQAFQRISTSTTATATIELYANNQTAPVPLMYSGAQVADNSMGSAQSGGYYYPDDMPQASLYFNAGYYQTSVDVTVTDGTLKLGIRKTSATDKSTTAWTCFDNFQLLYLGDGKDHGHDVNRDGMVDLQDVRALADIVLGLASKGDKHNYDFEAAKVDGDDAITINDVTTLIQQIQK